MTIDVRIETIEPQQAIMLRVKSSNADLGETMTKAVGELFEYLDKIDVDDEDIIGPLFAFYHFCEEPDQWEYSVGFPVHRPLPVIGDFTMGKLPGGKVAVTRHLGDYSGLKDQWDLLAEWIDVEGHESTYTEDDCWESYVVSPPIETDTSKFITELYWPIN